MVAVDDRESRRSIVAVIAGILISGLATGVRLSLFLSHFLSRAQCSPPASISYIPYAHVRFLAATRWINKYNVLDAFERSEWERADLP